MTGEKKSINLHKTLEQQEQNDETDGDDGDGDEDDDEGNDDDEALASPPPEARTREEPEEERARMGIGGLGSASRQFASTNGPSRGGIGSGRAGLGSSSTSQGSGPMDTAAPNVPTNFTSRRGIGSKNGFGTSNSEALLHETTDAAVRHPQRSFVREETGSAGSTPGPGTPKLSHEEKMHFSKLQGSFGARLMAKMGWQAVCLSHCYFTIF